MGIYIKGVNKPKECKHCKFTYIHEYPEAEDYRICQFIPDEPILSTGIDNRCPLIEVSTPHGRLGDLDELFERLKAWIEHDRHLYKTDTYSFEHLKHMLNGVSTTTAVIEKEK